MGILLSLHYNHLSISISFWSPNALFKFIQLPNVQFCLVRYRLFSAATAAVLIEIYEVFVFGLAIVQTATKWKSFCHLFAGQKFYLHCPINVFLWIFCHCGPNRLKGLGRNFVCYWFKKNSGIYLSGNVQGIPRLAILHMFWEVIQVKSSKFEYWDFRRCSFQVKLQGHDASSGYALSCSKGHKQKISTAFLRKIVNRKVHILIFGYFES